MAFTPLFLWPDCFFPVSTTGMIQKPKTDRRGKFFIPSHFCLIFVGCFKEN